MAAIGALATAGALIVAIIVFGMAAWESRSAAEKRAADAIRKTLVSASQESQALRDIVRGGSPYVAAEAEIADEFGRRLGPQSGDRIFTLLAPTADLTRHPVTDTIANSPS